MITRRIAQHSCNHCADLLLRNELRNDDVLPSRAEKQSSKRPTEGKQQKRRHYFEGSHDVEENYD